MKILKCVHHINFLVADVDAAVANFERLLGVGPFEFESLAGRDARTARVLIGDTWIVLLSPQHEDSALGRRLQERGEGFFLLSFGVDDLDEALDELARRGAARSPPAIRRGLKNWRVADLQTEDCLAAAFHLTELG